MLRDERERKLWDLLARSSLSVWSDLALNVVRLEEAMERAKLAHQAMSVDLPCVVEVGFLWSRSCP